MDKICVIKSLQIQRSACLVNDNATSQIGVITYMTVLVTYQWLPKSLGMALQILSNIDVVN